jgi:hypothetical protein
MAIGLVLLSAYWLFYPYKLLEFKDAIYPVINKEVKRGEILYIKTDVCKFTDKVSQTSRSFVDGIVFNIAQTTTSRSAGCVNDNVSIYVPENLPAGEYYLKNIYQYKVNPIRTITYIHNTEKFKVTK